nr:DEAD/DEAH box helicase [Deltaproteobacteria bacterium]
ADVRAAVVEEASRAALPVDLAPALGPLWSRLVQLRAKLRAHASPRSRATRASATWAFDPHGAMITWKERERVVRSRDYGTFSLVTRLTMPGGGTPQLECSCEVREATCTHAVALVDATLDVLADPARADLARTVADELLRPAWARALAELDRMEARAVEPRTAIEVWWHVEHELGTPALTPTVKKQTKRGGMSAGQRMTPARLLDEHGASLAEQDRRIAEDLAAWIPAKNTGSYPARAFLALVGHPRVTSDHDDEPIEVVRAELGFQALAADDQIRLEPAVAGARFSPRLLGALLQSHPPGEPLFVPEPERGRCLLLEVSDDARQLWRVLDRHGDAFPPESHAALLERLARMEGRLPVSVPHALKGREHVADIAVVVRLRLLPDVTLELELFVRPGPGAPLYRPGTGPRDVMIVRGGERGYVRRDLGSELAHARGLFARLPIEDAEEGPPQCFRIGEPDAALQLVEALQSPPDGLEVEWVDHPVSVGGLLTPDALRVHVEKKRDWFGLTGEIKIEAGRLELAVLLDAARRQQRYVRVDERRWVELSDTLRQRLQAVADQTFRARDHLELSPGAVPAMRALADAGAQVQAAEPWRELTERLASSRALRPRPPSTLVATLRDYQTEGHAWLTRLAAWGTGACLADDMGLGKTIQAIAVLLDRAKLGPALVLAPTSVAINWVRELARFAPSLNPILYTEQAERTTSLATLKKKDVMIASYGLLVRDAAELAATRFATLVIDEAQALKNPTTQRARAARNLDAAFRIALTGTPLENHIGELWSLFATVFPGMLGSWEQFRERYAVPIEKGKDPDARAALSRVIRPFLLRRTKQEVARELPSRTEIEVPVAMSAEELALYDDARLAAVAELTAKGAGMRDQQRRFQVLAALTRLRLLASHPRLYDATSTVPSSKLRRAVELLEELRSEGHRALVFSQFTSHLALVRSALADAGFKALYLDGATPARQRAKLVDSFQAGEADVFLISLKAGGTGINLTAADYVLHLDPWWNPAVEDQATDRAHRIGQTRPVTVYRLITRGTIEEQIVALHRDKRALVAGILEGTDVAARLSARDLMSLLQAPEPR